MGVVAKAPGKVVVLGEYAVLDGAPALVAAVDRRCRAEIAASPDHQCHLHTWAPEPQTVGFDPGSGSGVLLVDLVVAAGPAPPWVGRLDSRALYSGSSKLGMGSSAGALTAWAGAWRAFAGLDALTKDPEGLSTLIDLHRRFQDGKGSGLDVAAALFGGVLTFELREAAPPRVGSVRLPNSVGFAGVFTGCSASTLDFLIRYHEWRSANPAQAAERLGVLRRLAEVGCAGAAENDEQTFLGAVAEYGVRLEELGKVMGAEIVTREHRDIMNEARRHNVVYKVSGAGGGDLGLAFSADPETLRAFLRAMQEKSYRVIELGLDEQGLTVEVTV